MGGAVLWVHGTRRESSYMIKAVNGIITVRALRTWQRSELIVVSHQNPQITQEPDLTRQARQLVV